MKRHAPFSRRGEQAVQAFQEAANLDATPRVSAGDGIVYGDGARRARTRGEILLQPAAPILLGAGEAITSKPQGEEIFKGAHAKLLDTLEHPNSISAGASGDRISAALAAGVLEPAIDAAVSAQARNSIEKMLCHQLAAAHHAAMGLLERTTGPGLEPHDVARLMNAAARLMDVYQTGCLALLKLKAKGRQRVVVQYVNVGAGGQAVVAGRVGRGSQEAGEVSKSTDQPHGS
jgi:hypothetical protein